MLSVEIGNATSRRSISVWIVGLMCMMLLGSTGHYCQPIGCYITVEFNTDGQLQYI